MEQSGRFPVLREFRLGAGRVKLAKAFRANARHCLAVAKKQQTIKTRLQWLEKAELWLELARLTEEPMIWGDPRKSETRRPAAGDLVLLADTSLICEPDFYRVDADRLLTRGCVQARGEAFLKSSIAPAACA